MDCSIVQVFAIVGGLSIETYGYSRTCGALSYPHCSQKGFNSIPLFEVSSERRNSSNLYLAGNNITTIFGQSFVTLGVNQIQHIDLSDNYINNIAKNAFNNVNQTLEILLLRHNHIRRLFPHYFIQLVKLKSLDVSYNQIVTLDNSLVGLKSLMELNLDNNRIESLPDYLIREREDCLSCIATGLAPQIHFSLRQNSLRYMPTCSIETLQEANPQSNVQVSSMSTNALYCDCMDALWSQVHLSDFANESNVPTTCFFTHVMDVRNMPVSGLLSEELGICPTDIHHATIRCIGAQLFILKSPSVLTPTLKFGVREDAADIKHYNISLIALDGTLRHSKLVPASTHSYTIPQSVGIRPNTDYTFCLEPCSELGHSPSPLLDHQFYGKICIRYLAASGSGPVDKVVDNRVFQEYVYGVLGFTIVILLCGLVTIYFFKWRAGRHEGHITGELSITTHRNSKLRRHLLDTEPSFRSRSTAGEALRFPGYSRNIPNQSRSPSGVYENNSDLKIQNLIRKSLSVSPSAEIVINSNPDRMHGSVMASVREMGELSPDINSVNTRSAASMTSQATVPDVQVIVQRELSSSSSDDFVRPDEETNSETVELDKPKSMGSKKHNM